MGGGISGVEGDARCTLVLSCLRDVLLLCARAQSSASIDKRVKIVIRDIMRVKHSADVDFQSVKMGDVYLRT